MRPCQVARRVCVIDYDLLVASSTRDSVCDYRSGLSLRGYSCAVFSASLFCMRREGRVKALGSEHGRVPESLIVNYQPP